MATVLGGAGALAGPTGAEFMNQSTQNMIQGMGQFGNNAAQFAANRNVDLESRRKFLLDMAKANGMSPALFIASPGGQQAVRSILGDNFFGMIGPNKAKWEGLMGMPMSEEDWSAFSRVAYKQGDILGPQGRQAPAATSGTGAGGVPSTAPASVPGGVPSPAPTPKPTVGVQPRIIQQASPEGSQEMAVLENAQGQPLMLGDSISEVTAMAQAYNRIAQGVSTPAEIKRYFPAASEAAAKLEAADMVRKYREIGYDPYTAAPSTDMSYPEKVDSTDPKDAGSINSSDYNFDKTQKWASIPTTPEQKKPVDVSAEAFAKYLYANKLIKNEKLSPQTLSTLIANNPGTYKKFVEGMNAPAQASTGVGAEKPVAGTSPVLNVLTTGTAPAAGKDTADLKRDIEQTSRDVVRGYRANPAAEGDAYKKRLETAATMLNTVDPGKRIEDHPMLARAVLNFDQQAYRKTEADLKLVESEIGVRAGELAARLAATEIAGMMSNNQRAAQMLEPLQKIYETRWKPIIEQAAKNNKDPKEVTKLLNEDAGYQAFESLLNGTINKAYGENSTVTQVWNKDKLGVIAWILGGQAKQTAAGFTITDANAMQSMDPAMVEQMYRELGLTYQ